MSKSLHFCISSLISLCILSLLSFLHLPWLSGIKGISLLYLIAPCLAVSLPWFSGFLMILSKKLLWSFLCMGIMPITFNIPTFGALAYWTYDHWFIRFVIPASCMAVFILHPTGYHAAAYTLYWLIPLILYVLPYRNLFLTALGATFVQHAIGSVMWLYLGSLPAHQWLALIPVVFIERMLSVCLMVSIVIIIKALEPTLKRLYTRIHKNQLLRA